MEQHMRGREISLYMPFLKKKEKEEKGLDVAPSVSVLQQLLCIKHGSRTIITYAKQPSRLNRGLE